MLPRGAVEIDT
jgi:hypothetical protein